MLIANKKYIDTANIKHLLGAGEKNADKIQIAIDRFYQQTDLSDCLFTLRAINSGGGLVMQNLEKEVTESQIILTWVVDENFTAVSGALSPEIVGQNADIIVIKYEMTPMIVRNSILEQYHGGIDAIDKALREMQSILAQAEQLIAKMPIIKNGTWWLYDATTGDYQDSGFPAKGDPGVQGLPGEKGEKGDTGADGFSPTATVVKSGSVVTITITDRNGTTTASMTESTDVDLTEVNASIATLQATVSDSQTQLQELTDNYTNYTGSTNNAIDILETLSHAHENKDLLDRITTPQHVHWHSNITVLQTITQDMLNGMMDASRQKHVHINKTVLDNITEEKTKVWDEKANTQDVAKVQDQLNILKDSYTNNCIRVDGNIGKLQQLSHSHEAATIYVNATAGSDSNDGSTTAKAFATLEKALKAAANAKKATIRLAAGTYTIPNKTITLTSSYLAIVGTSQSDTIVKGNLNLDNSYLKLFDISLDCTDSEYADTSAEAPIRALSNSSVHLVRVSIYTATKYCISATEISNVYCYNSSFSGCTSYSIMLTGGTSATIYGSADISTKGLCSGYGCRAYLVNNSYFTYKSTNYGLVYLNGQQVLPQTAETAAVLSMGGNV